MRRYLIRAVGFASGFALAAMVVIGAITAGPADFSVAAAGNGSPPGGQKIPSALLDCDGENIASTTATLGAPSEVPVPPEEALRMYLNRRLQKLRPLVPAEMSGLAQEARAFRYKNVNDKLAGVRREVEFVENGSTRARFLVQKLGEGWVVTASLTCAGADKDYTTGGGEGE